MSGALNFMWSSVYALLVYAITKNGWAAALTFLVSHRLENAYDAFLVLVKSQYQIATLASRDEK